MASLKLLLQALQTSGGLAPLVVALVAVLALHLLLRGGRAPARPRGPVTLSPGVKVELPLVSRTELSHDTRRFRFALPSAQHVLGLPVGKHVMISYLDAKGAEVARPYTPTSSDDDLGFVELVVKVYFKNVNANFPAGGLMSQHMEQLKLGDTLAFEGPKGKFTYKGRGTFAVKLLASQGGGEKLRKCTQLGMIAGGTGITPMLQVVTAVLKDKGDKTKVSLIFANQTEDDILCRKELETLAAENPNFKLYYTLDRPPSKWAYGTGFISAEMIKANLPPPGKNTLVMVCGPPPMINRACKPAFAALGYADESLLIW